MSGNYGSFADDLATQDDEAEAATEFDAEDPQDTRVAGIIVHE